MTSEEMREFGVLIGLPKVTAQQQDRLGHLCEAFAAFDAGNLGEGPPERNTTMMDDADEIPAVLTLGFPRSADMHRVLECLTEREIEAYIVGVCHPEAARPSN